MATLGTTVAVSGIAGQATAAQPSDREIFQQGLKIREETGETEPFENHILNRGFDIAHQNTETYSFDRPTGGISTQRFEKPNLDLFASVYTTEGHISAYSDWTIEFDSSDAWNDFEDDGEAPVDLIGIGWEHSDYDIIWNSWNSGSTTSKREASVNNISFNFDDAEAFISRSRSFGDYATVDLEAESGTSFDERSIIVNYTHTWRGGEVTGVSFDASGGMSVGVGIAAQKWDSPKQSYSSE